MRRNRKLVLATLLACFIWVSGTLAGCAFFKSNRPETARQLAVEGVKCFHDDDYADALKTFTTLKERYPYSRYAVLAELKVADAHFCMEQYPEAIASYDDFARMHPKNQVVPYVLYQIGECHYRQLLSVDRDQTETRQAILAFERFLKAYPRSTYTTKARRKIQACRERLAEHELYVGRFYFKSKYYRAALARFESALTDYRDALTADKEREVKQMILSCREKISENGSAEEEHKRMIIMPEEPIFGTVGP
ncbi:MAG: outer membrane protein assembly factor BamD [Syntrophobacteria bacterium]